MAIAISAMANTAANADDLTTNTSTTLDDGTSLQFSVGGEGRFMEAGVSPSWYGGLLAKASMCKDVLDAKSLCGGVHAFIPVHSQTEVSKLGNTISTNFVVVGAHAGSKIELAPKLSLGVQGVAEIMAFNFNIINLQQEFQDTAYNAGVDIELAYDINEAVQLSAHAGIGLAYAMHPNGYYAPATKTGKVGLKIGGEF